MRVDDAADIAATLETLRRERYGRVLGPQRPKDNRTLFERYYDSLPHVRKAKEQEEAEREARLPRSAAGALRDALVGVEHQTDDPETIDRKRNRHIALNGAGVLRAALAGGSGTINGASAATVESVASVICRGFPGRTNYAG